MSRILVTGGAGFIGSHTANQLLKLGHEVIVLDNLSTGFRESVSAACTLIEGDILDRDLLVRSLRDERIEAVIHFAAKLNVAESMQKPQEYYQNNVVGLLNLISAMGEVGVNKIVFSSSGTVYGNIKDQGTIDETLPTFPINPYGHSKLIGERMLQDISQNTDLRYVILRYFNAAGASHDGKNGQRSRESTHIIKICAEAAIGKRDSVSILGDDYGTADGSCVRDYIHVEDLADIHIRSLDHLMVGGASETMNCGSGQGYSVKEIVKTMQAVSGVPFDVHTRERRPGDPAYLVADNFKLRRVLRWTHPCQDIQKICQSAYAWETRLMSELRGNAAEFVESQPIEI